MLIGKILNCLCESNIACTAASVDGRIAFSIDGKKYWYRLDGALALMLYDMSKKKPGKALNIAKQRADEIKRPDSKDWEENPDKR